MGRVLLPDAAVLRWRDIAVQEIRKKMRVLRVHDTYALIRSMQITARNMGASSYKATIMYNYYGIFPDLGVGRGQSAGDVAVNKLAGSRRKRKNWTREIAAQRHRFGEIVAESMADQATGRLAAKLDGVKRVFLNV